MKVNDIIKEKVIDGLGQEKITKYKIIKFLGKGGFAKVYEAKNLSNNKHLALKTIQNKNLKTEKEKQKLKMEVKIHQELNHENICKFHRVFKTKKNTFIVLELCKNGSLKDLLKKRKTLTPLEVRGYIHKLTIALIYLKKLNIIHRDLKIGNLFLDETMVLKVGDFGLAARLMDRKELRYSVCGTPNYISPETLLKKGHSFEVDIWALGVIMFRLLFGISPFQTKTVRDTYRKIKKGEFIFPERSFFNAEKVLRKIFLVDPKERISLEEFLESDFMSESLIPEFFPRYTLIKPLEENFRVRFEEENNNFAAKKEDYEKYNLKSKIKLKTKKDFSKTSKESLKKKKSLEKDKILKSDDFSNSTISLEKNELEKTIKTETLQIKSSETITKSIKKKYVIVKKFSDFSNNYGIGYITNNNLIGVLFNDRSSLIYKRKSKNIIYREFSKENNNYKYYAYELGFYYKNLKKKYLIFHKLSNFILRINTKFSFKEKNDLKFEILKKEDLDFIYIQKFLKTKFCIMLQNSDNVLQVIFKNNAEIWIDNINKQIVFLTTNGEKYFYELEEVFNEKIGSLKKYMLYINEIFDKFKVEKKKS